MANSILPNFDRQDPEARAQSFDFQGNTFRILYADAIPTDDELRNADENEVIRVLADKIQSYRSEMGHVLTEESEISNERSQIDTAFKKNKAMAQGSTHNFAPATARFNENKEAAVRTLYEFMVRDNWKKLLENIHKDNRPLAEKILSSGADREEIRLALAALALRQPVERSTTPPSSANIVLQEPEATFEEPSVEDRRAALKAELKEVRENAPQAELMAKLASIKLGETPCIEIYDVVRYLRDTKEASTRITPDTQREYIVDPKYLRRSGIARIESFEPPISLKIPRTNAYDSDIDEDRQVVDSQELQRNNQNIDLLLGQLQTDEENVERAALILIEVIKLFKEKLSITPSTIDEAHYPQLHQMIITEDGTFAARQGYLSSALNFEDAAKEFKVLRDSALPDQSTLQEREWYGERGQQIRDELRVLGETEAEQIPVQVSLPEDRRTQLQLAAGENNENMEHARLMDSLNSVTLGETPASQITEIIEEINKIKDKAEQITIFTRREYIEDVAVLSPALRARIESFEPSISLKIPKKLDEFDDEELDIEKFEENTENIGLLIGQLETELERIESARNDLGEMIDVFRNLLITERMVDETDYPLLQRILIDTDGNFNATSQELDSSLDFEEVAQEFKRLRDHTLPERRPLDTVEFYENKRDEIAKELSQLPETETEVSVPEAVVPPDNSGETAAVPATVSNPETHVEPGGRTPTLVPARVATPESVPAAQTVSDTMARYANLNGSALCWKIIEEEVEAILGRRGTEFNNVINYMRAQINHSAKSERDIQRLAEDANGTPAETPALADRHWQEHHPHLPDRKKELPIPKQLAKTSAVTLATTVMAGIVTGAAAPMVLAGIGTFAVVGGLPYLRYKLAKNNLASAHTTLNVYKEKILTKKNLGIDVLKDNSYNDFLSEKDFNKLIEGYFKLNYFIFKAPQETRIPLDTDLKRILIDMYRAIIKRAEHEFPVTIGANPAEMRTSAEDRITDASRAIFGQGDKIIAPYEANLKSIAQHAYHETIHGTQEAVDNWNNRMTLRKTIVNPVRKFFGYGPLGETNTSTNNHDHGGHH